MHLRHMMHPGQLQSSETASRDGKRKSPEQIQVNNCTFLVSYSRTISDSVLFLEFLHADVKS